MSDSYSRLAAIRDYWMPRVHDVDVRLPDLDEILREFVRLTRQRDALLEALRKLEYSSDGCIKRYPEESEVNAVLKAVEGEK